MFGLLFVAAAVAYVLRVNVSIAAPAIKKDLGLSEVQLGLILSAFVTSYALFQIPGAALGERFGPRRVLTWCFAGWGILTLLVSVVPPPHQAPIWFTLAILVVLRGALGVLQAPFFPVCTGGTIAAWFQPARWGLVNGLQNVGYTLASAAAGPIGVWMILQLGWRHAIAITGPASIALAAAWWWDNRDDPREHPDVNGGELAIIGEGREAAVTPMSGWTSVLTDRALLLLTTSYFALNYVFYLFFNWFYYYLTEVRHIPATLAGYFSAEQWIVGAVATVAGGYACDRISRVWGPTRGCRVTAMGGILVATPCLVVGAAMDNPLIMVALLSISFGSTTLVDSPYWVAAMRIAGPRAALATGLLNTGGNLSGGLAAILVPFIARSFGWTAAIGSAVMFAIVAAVLWLWIGTSDPETVTV